ncbi:uncharacterized protein BDV17DRAFT_271444 [Aspergillus undulatus]|uniref:uncharacterized protein n=1 Tax=Aspergillus undulatus TaxID=1810928 RepID=UPI003CCE01B1
MSGPPPGSAEFLASLLVEELNHSCPHTPKLTPGIESKIPPRLGFFHQTDEDISYIDTSKLCAECYHAAVPRGFLCWSAFYAKPERNVYRPDHNYLTGEPTRGDNAEFFPRQIQAGKEAFFLRAQPMPSANSKAHRLLGPLEYNPRASQYEARGPVLPANGDTRAVWAFFEFAKWPFYIDILHIDPPWQDNVGDAEAQKAEDDRVGFANAAAYLGAAFVVNAVPEGGYGPYSAMEQRLAQVGSYRVLPLGQWRENAEDDDYADFGRELPGDMERRSQILVTAEVDPSWYPGQGKDAFKGGQFMYFPSEELVDKNAEEAIGTRLEPTVDERLRRQYEGELPEKRVSFLLQPGGETSDPGPSAVVESEEPLPRMSDVPELRWPEDERAAYELSQGMQGVEVGTSYPVEPVILSKSRESMFNPIPMERMNSRGVREDGRLTADRHDFNVHAQPHIPYDCRINKCHCPKVLPPDCEMDICDCPVEQQVNGTFEKEHDAPRDHTYAGFVKRAQQSLGARDWAAEPSLDEEKDALWLEGLRVPKGWNKSRQQGPFRYPKWWYEKRG